MAFRGEPTIKTPDLNELVNHCIDLDPSFHVLHDFADELNPYSTIFRYPGDLLMPENSDDLGFSQIAGLTDYKPPVYPAVLISVITGLTSFDNYIVLTNFIHYNYPVIAVIVKAGLGIFLLISALLLNKRAKAN